MTSTITQTSTTRSGNFGSRPSGGRFSFDNGDGFTSMSYYLFVKENFRKYNGATYHSGLGDATALVCADTDRGLYWLRRRGYGDENTFVGSLADGVGRLLDV